MKCNECGNTKGYKKYCSVHGLAVTNYNADGSIDYHNDEMHDSLLYRRERAAKHCNVCDNVLTKKQLESE